MNTIRGCVGSTRLLLNWLSEQDIAYSELTYNHLLDFVNHCKSLGNTVHTVNQKIQSIKHFYDHLVKEGLVENNPAEELRIKGKINRQPHDLLEWEEIEQLYQDFPNQNLAGKRNKAMVGVMIYQGLTSAEIAALEVKDIKLEEGQLYIPQVGRSNSRTLKLHPVQILELQKYITGVREMILELAGKKTEKLFISTGDGRRLENSMARMLKKLKLINPKVKSVKQIRSSVITCWLQHHNIRQVQYMAGHRYISSTERYRTDLLESLQEQLDDLHPLK